MASVAERWQPSASGPTARRQPVKVCFVIDELSVGGTETQLLKLIAGLDRDCVAPSLCLLRGDDPRSQGLEPADCPVLRLGVRRLAHPAIAVKLLTFARFLRSQRIDVVQTYFPDSTYFGVTAARLAGVRRVVRTRRDLFHYRNHWQRYVGRWIDWLQGRLLVDHFLANSQACRDDLVGTERVAPAKVTIIPNGIDLALFAGAAEASREATRTERAATIGIVANLRPEKRLDVLLDAGRRVVADHPKLRIRMAGDGPLRETLLATIDRLGLGENAALEGAVRDIPRFLAELDVAVLCSDTEGSPNAVLEYMAAGRAIVATEVGGIRELLTHDKNSLLVPPNDAPALAGAISTLVTDPARARRLAGQARVDVRDYSLRRMVTRHEQFYRELVSARSGD